MQAPCLLQGGSALTPPCWVPVGQMVKENSNVRMRVVRAEPAFPLSAWVVCPERLFLVDNVYLQPLHLISTLEKPERIWGRKGRWLCALRFQLGSRSNPKLCCLYYSYRYIKTCHVPWLCQESKNSDSISSGYWTLGTILGFVPFKSINLTRSRIA